MAYLASDRAVRSPAFPHSLASGYARLRARITVYRRKRAIYLRTLRELESYSQRELHDLKIDPADFRLVARQNAGLAA